MFIKNVEYDGYFWNFIPEFEKGDARECFPPIRCWQLGFFGYISRKTLLKAKQEAIWLIENIDEYINKSKAYAIAIGKEIFRGEIIHPESVHRWRLERVHLSSNRNFGQGCFSLSFVDPEEPDYLLHQWGVAFKNFTPDNIGKD